MASLREDLFHLASHGVPPNEATAQRLTVALDGFLDFWTGEVLPFVAEGGSELRFLEAPYGRGKTHLLLLMAHTARLAGFATAVVHCSTESKPFASVAETYRSIIPALRFPSTQKPSGADIFEFLRALPKEQLQALCSSRRICTGYQNLLVSYARRAAMEPMDRVLVSRLSDLIRARPENLVRIPELYRLDHRLPRPLGKLGKRTAMPWLRGLLTMPREARLKGVVVLFDETGADFHLARETRRVQREHFANLRNLIDYLGVGRLPGCVITYAVAAEIFLEKAKEILPPLAQRIERTLSQQRNPRAVWCQLEELTRPATDTAEFFTKLGGRLVEAGREAGFHDRRIAAASALIAEEAPQMAGSIHSAVVREFIKKITVTITG